MSLSTDYKLNCCNRHHFLEGSDFPFGAGDAQTGNTSSPSQPNPLAGRVEIAQSPFQSLRSSFMNQFHSQGFVMFRTNHPSMQQRMIVISTFMTLQNAVKNSGFPGSPAPTAPPVPLGGTQANRSGQNDLSPLADEDAFIK